MVAYAKQWRSSKDNKIKKAVYDKKYSETHRDVVRKIQRDYCARIKKKAIDALGGKCKSCDFKDVRALRVVGTTNVVRDYDKFRSGHQYYTYVLSNLSSYKLQCGNCKRIEMFSLRSSSHLRSE